MDSVRTAFLFFCVAIGVLAVLGLRLATLAMRLLLTYGPTVIAVGIFIYIMQDMVRWVWRRNHATPLPAAKHRKAKA